MVELIQVGIVLLITSIVLIFVGALTSKSENVKVGFGGFIGPIPFGWANDPRFLWVIIGISIVFFILFWLRSSGFV
ncbi:MAG TPA: hypothetical protein VJH90_02980 [archaeon]|nr:hypothetical protein [archaeon]